MDFRVEIRNRAFEIQEILENEILDIKWDYSRIGGCGEFEFTLPRNYCDEKYISGDFNIRIYLRSGAGTYDLWYQGLVEDKVPDIRGTKEVVRVVGHGYSAQLSRIQIDRDYTNDEIARDVIKDIIDTDIVPNTDILSDDGDIVATSYTVSSLTFNTNAKRCVETCADLAGAREWGVDENRKFYFKARSSTVGFTFPLGKNIMNFSSVQSFKDIVNRVIVQGADVGGSPFTRTINDTNSQAKYGLRTRVQQNSSITNNTDADQLGNSILAEYAQVSRRATCDLINYETRIETTIPIPLFNLKTQRVTYGTRKYGTFLYSGLVDRQINRINYSIDSNRAFKVSLSLGQLRPSIAENISRLEYELEQNRTKDL